MVSVDWFGLTGTWEQGRNLARGGTYVRVMRDNGRVIGYNLWNSARGETLIDWTTIATTAATSAVISAVVSGLLARRTNERAVQIENITKERAE